MYRLLHYEPRNTGSESLAHWSLGGPKLRCIAIAAFCTFSKLTLFGCADNYCHGWLTLPGVVDSDNSELVCSVGLKRGHLMQNGHHTIGGSVVVRWILGFVLDDVGLNGFRVARAPRQSYWVRCHLRSCQVCRRQRQSWQYTIVQYF